MFRGGLVLINEFFRSNSRAKEKAKKRLEKWYLARHGSAVIQSTISKEQQNMTTNNSRTIRLTKQNMTVKKQLVNSNKIRENKSRTISKQQQSMRENKRTIGKQQETLTENKRRPLLVNKNKAWQKTRAELFVNKQQNMTKKTKEELIRIQH